MLAMKAYVGKNVTIQLKEVGVGPVVFFSDAFLTELTWQVLIEGH